MRLFGITLMLAMLSFNPLISMADDSSVSDLSGWKWGVGFGSLRNGHQSGFDFVSPSLFSFGKNGVSMFTLFAGFGIITLPDSDISSGELEDTSHFALSYGVRISDRIPTPVQSYVKLGGNHINWDSKLMTYDGRATSDGLLVAFGADLFRGQPGGFGAKDSSAFVEVEMRSGHRRVDQLPGSPHLFNGAGINFGYRMHY